VICSIHSPQRKTRLVHDEDDRRVAVPPQFVFLTTKGTKYTKVKKNALCNWLSPVYAITGIPVTVYSARPFFVTKFRRLRRCFSAETSTSFLLHDLLSKSNCGRTVSFSIRMLGLDLLFELLDHHAYYS
jgi:hypothetical protein